MTSKVLKNTTIPEAVRECIEAGAQALLIYSAKDGTPTILAAEDLDGVLELVVDSDLSEKFMLFRKEGEA